MSNYEKNGWEREFLYYMPDLPLIGEWVDKFDVDDYMSWFQEININTIIWQIIIIAILIWYHKETKRFLEVLTDKIAGLIYASRKALIFDKEKTEKAIKEGAKKWKDEQPKTKNSKKSDLKKKLYDVLDKELEAYEYTLQPNKAFLEAFDEIERLLRDIHSKVMPASSQRTSYPPTIVIFYELVKKNFINSTTTDMFNVSLRLRNLIKHGGKPIKNSEEAKIYFKPLVIIKYEIDNAMVKILQREAKIRQQAAKF